jgi:CTP:molybdopterin cytidylyltransferase MocA
MRGAIIAGGGATRFGGRPKGLELVAGVRILDRLVDAMVAAFGELPLLVANAPNAGDWRPGLRVVADAVPGLGSSAESIPPSASPRPVVVAAWDMPFVTSELLRELAAGLEIRGRLPPASDGPRGSSRSARPTVPRCAGHRGRPGPGTGGLSPSTTPYGSLSSMAKRSAVLAIPDGCSST